MSLSRRQHEPGLRLGVHVADEAAPVAHEVLMWIVRVRIVALRPGADRDLEDLAQVSQFLERVVHRRPADFRKSGHGSCVHVVSGEVDMLARQQLGDDPPLCGHAPLPLAEARDEIFRHVV